MWMYLNRSGADATITFKDKNRGTHIKIKTNEIQDIYIDHVGGLDHKVTFVLDEYTEVSRIMSMEAIASVTNFIDKNKV